MSDIKKKFELFLKGQKALGREAGPCQIRFTTEELERIVAELDEVNRMSDNPERDAKQTVTEPTKYIEKPTTKIDTPNDHTDVQYHALVQDAKRYRLIKERFAQEYFKVSPEEFDAWADDELRSARE